MAERPTLGLDTSCTVPIVATWHEHHARTLASYRQHISTKRPIIAAHALLESYSVLTRLPLPYQMKPAVAERALRHWFGALEVVGIDALLAWEALGETAQADRGGRILYDAVIARCTFLAGAKEILTWNVRDFVRVAPIGLSVITPA